MIFPLSRTNILLQSLKYHKRFETMITVLPKAISGRASFSLISLSTSNPVMASSRIRILGFLINALAIASFYLKPVDIFDAFSSRNVSYPSGNDSISSCAKTFFAAQVILSIDEDGIALAIVSLIVAGKK